MKAIRHIAALGLTMAFATLTLTSCLDDDNDVSAQVVKLTEAQKQEVIEKLNGTYYCKLHYTSASIQREDSVSIVWDINGKTAKALCRNFPVDVLANYIAVDSVKQALREAGTQEVRCSYTTPDQAYQDEFSYDIFIYPFTVSEKLSYTTQKGYELEVYFSDDLNYSGSYGRDITYSQMFQRFGKLFQGSFIVEKVFYNGYAHEVKALLPFY